MLVLLLYCRYQLAIPCQLTAAVQQLCHDELLFLLCQRKGRRCAQMHSGFFAMRNHMPFNLNHDAPLNPVPPEVKVDIERMLALWAECRAAATEPGPYLFGRVSLADAFFAPIAVRLRTYQVQLPAVDQAYVETVYQWPAFKAWQKAGLEELNP